MGLVKGVKNIFGRKSRKLSKQRAQLGGLQDPLANGNALQDDIQWVNNPAHQAPGHVNPLFDANAPVPRDPNAMADNPFAVEARARRNVTGKKEDGKRLGKTRMKDRHVGHNSGRSAEVGDSAHEVQRVNYAREIGDSGTNEGFFKPEHADEWHKSGSAEDSGIGAADAVLDDDGEHFVVTEQSNLIARSVANTRLDQRLGLDTIAHEYEGKHNGQRGVVSAKTHGAAAGDIEHDYSNPETQRSLANLQAFDYLSNQQDRHDGNIFIDQQSGAAKGIDNDLSFGKNTTRNNDKHKGLPSQVDAAMADRITGMTAQEMYELTSGEDGDYQHLSEEERQAAAGRLQTLQEHIAETDDNGRRIRVVDEWNDDTFNAAVDPDAQKAAEMNGPAFQYDSASYISRLHHTQEKVRAAQGQAE